MFLDSRDKSLNMLKFCRNDQREGKSKGSVFVAESAYNAQNAQFGLVMIEGRARAKKRHFLVNIFQKVPENAFFSVFFFLRRRKFFKWYFMVF